MLTQCDHFGFFYKKKQLDVTFFIGLWKRREGVYRHHFLNVTGGSQERGWTTDANRDL